MRTRAGGGGSASLSRRTLEDGPRWPGQQVFGVRNGRLEFFTLRKRVGSDIVVCNQPRRCSPCGNSGAEASAPESACRSQRRRTSCGACPRPLRRKPPCCARFSLNLTVARLSSPGKLLPRRKEQRGGDCGHFPKRSGEERQKGPPGIRFQDVRV
eukprot:scaffold8_cov249-Pinguiococcus_pyrenoidosus.AAC.22